MIDTSKIDKRKPMHGTGKARGCSHAKLGNFGRLFPHLQPQAEQPCKGWDLTDPCVADEVSKLVGGAGGPMHDANGSSGDSELPAAYTFFAQFVDHDVTLDTTTALRGGPEVPEKVPNLRTASLDLDCVYGFGPEASPHLFDPAQDGRLLVGSRGDGVYRPNDVPRSSAGRALIGDPRNDENLFVSQMQLVFLRLHNRFLLRYGFEEAQRETRFHYQYVVWNDFLRRVCDEDVWKFANAGLLAKKKKYPLCDIKDRCHGLFMPVEFSVAAFRFGHTTVRSSYPANLDFPSIELFDERFGTEGFAPVPDELAVDWRTLLDLEPGFTFRRAKAFDQLLPDELIRMPDPVVGKRADAAERSLAFRNLRRGIVLGLPSGQDVAQALLKKGYGFKPATTAQLFKEKGKPIPRWDCLPASLRACLEKHTPLFLYLMLEARSLGKKERLGPVG